MKIKNTTKALIIGVLLAVSLGACSANQPPVDQIGLYYTTGWIEGRHFQEVVEPGSGTKWTFNDYIDWLPTNQRNYIVSKTVGEGDRETADFIQVPAKGGIAMDFEISTYFKLNTRTDDIDGYEGGTARKFNEQICKKYHCTTDDGWDQMLNDNFRKIIETSMRQRVFNYNVDELWANAVGEQSGTEDAILKIQADIAASIKDNLNRTLGGQYFCGPTFDRNLTSQAALKQAAGNQEQVDELLCPDFQFIINSAEPASGDVKASFDKQRVSFNDVVTAENYGAAKKKEAEGVAAAQAASQQALTPEYIDFLQAQAMNKCAERPDCTLIFSNGSAPNVNVQAGR